MFFLFVPPHTFLLRRNPSLPLMKVIPGSRMDAIIVPEAKRRKLRKGTHSCWECKHRKMKCVLGPNATTPCNGCLRRGSNCISQEIPEDEIQPTPSTTTSSEEAPSSATDCGILTPVSKHDGPDQSKFQYATDASASHRKHESLSRLLHDSLPSPKDTQRICEAIRHHNTVLAHEFLTMPYTTLVENGLKTPERLLDIPDPTLHPVLMARHMLQLATFLQHLHPNFHEIHGLSESPRVMMERLADLAIRLVTTNDEFLGSVEGLECVMIETMYQANIGNIRRSWVSNRRAMGIAQLMGLNRPDNRAQYKVLDHRLEYHPQLMWLRIVILDRYLCLMLGLPQGCLDRSMASEATLASDTPMGRLERMHCVIASQILERNEQNPTNSHNLALTRSLDIDLQKAARSLPSKWWLAPNLDSASADSQTLFWDTRRLFAQVLHYNLLNQLHLPFMLLSSSAGKREHEYSRIACANASREVLSRFITVRRFNRIAYSCRTIDFLALMAAMTLLLAHLENHGSEAQNLLAHQYISDRAMIEQAQENMREVNRFNSDALSAQSADLLSRLLAIEVDAPPGGHACRTARVSVEETATETAPLDGGDDAVVSVHIPYFGVIKISRGGVSREASSVQTSTVSYDTAPPAPSNQARPEAGLGPIPNTVANNVDVDHFVPIPVVQSDGYPGLAAGAEDWAFQGVDMAFFDSLIRSAGSEVLDDADWTGG